MIRLQDIADMAGVSRTTVSNVINGNTKRVSQETIDKITAILKEQNYVPHMGSVMLSGHGSRIIGVVLGFAQAHGMYSLQDSFVGELVGTIQMEAETKGYYVMLIGGENIQIVAAPCGLLLLLDLHASRSVILRLTILMASFWLMPRMCMVTRMLPSVSMNSAKMRSWISGA